MKSRINNEPGGNQAMKSDLIIDGDGHVVGVNETYAIIAPAYLAMRPE